MDIARRVGNSEIAEFIINHEPLPKGDEHYMYTYSNQDTNHDDIRCALYVLGSLGMVCMASQTFQNHLKPKKELVVPKGGPWP